METIIRRVDPVAPDAEAIRLAASFLQKGGLVAFPTETVYGLGADAMNEAACAGIYAAKGRPGDNPLIIHIAEREALSRIAIDIPEAAMRLAEAFWPGPLTMILQKHPDVPLRTTGGLQTVAVRWPAHPVAQALILASGGLIAAPSANRSGRPSPTRASDCVEDLNGRVEMILDGGTVGKGLESTIVDLTVEPFALLRPGFVTRTKLQELLGPAAGALASPEGEAQDAAPKAPGMKYRHYAPKGQLTVFEGDPERVADAVAAALQEASARGARTGVLTTMEHMDRYRADVLYDLGSHEEPEEIGGRLFAGLREMDARDVTEIFAEGIPDSGVGEAVMNRLRKAAGGHCIRV